MSCKSTYVSSTRTVVVVLRSNKVATRESSMTLEEGYEGPGMAGYLWRPLRVSVTLFGYMRFSWLSSTTWLPRCFAADTRCQNRAWNLRLPLVVDLKTRTRIRFLHRSVYYAVVVFSIFSYVPVSNSSFQSGASSSLPVSCTTSYTYTAGELPW